MRLRCALRACAECCRYLLFAAEPYETISFKIPNMEVDRNVEDAKFYTNWDRTARVFTVCSLAGTNVLLLNLQLQLHFKKLSA